MQIARYLATQQLKTAIQTNFKTLIIIWKYLSINGNFYNG